MCDYVLFNLCPSHIFTYSPFLKMTLSKHNKYTMHGITVSYDLNNVDARNLEASVKIYAFRGDDIIEAIC
jgi:hypothetical protein